MIYIHNKPSWFVPKFDAITIMNHIFVKSEVKDDKALIEHEKTHVRQFKRDWLFPIKYLFNEQLRYEYELQAYIVQLEYLRCNGLEYISAIDSFSELLTNDYNLHKYQPDVLRDLKNALNKQSALPFVID